MQRLEGRFVPRQKPVVWVELDRAMKMRDRFGFVSCLCVGDGEHVLDLLAIRCLGQRRFEVLECFLCGPSIQSESRGIHSFFEAFRRGGRSGVTLAHLQIPSAALVELALVRKLPNHLSKPIRCHPEVAALECL